MQAFQLFNFLHPENTLRVRGHAPIAAWGKADGADFRAVRHGGALKLLGEEAADECTQSGENREIVILAVKRGFCHGVELERRRAAVHHVIEEEVVQGICAEGILRALGQFPLFRGDEFGGDRRIQNIFDDGHDFAAQSAARVTHEMPL